jgi:Zn-dependent peptidase ImmA (M78 family)
MSESSAVDETLIDAGIHGTGDPEHDAQLVLQRYWNFGPANAVPVDPVFIAQAMGLDVLSADLGDGVGGMLLKRPHSQPVIYLNQSDPRARQRFTCSHEIGHWMKRRAAQAVRPDDWAFVDRRDQLSGRGTDPDERYANGFAAALLMPSQPIKELRDLVSTNVLASHFNVSAEAMTYRLANLSR